MESLRQHSTKAERQSHIDAWYKSGLSKSAYSRQNQLSYQTFINWHKKLKPSRPEKTPSKFLKVEVASKSNHSTENFATLTFSNQLTVELHQEVSAQFLIQLLTCK